MNYPDYIKKMGLTNRQVIEILNPHFPKFSKAQCSMIAHPEDYGVRLTAAAVSKLPPLRKATPQRKKPNRLVVYLNDELYALLLEAKGEASTQDYLEKLIVGELNREAKN